MHAARGYEMILMGHHGQQARSQPSRWGGGGSELGWVEHYTGADTGFPEGGGGEDIHKHPPLNIVRVTSSALRKMGKHPHSWTFTRGGAGIFLSNLQGGHLRFWTFSKTNFGPFLTKDAKLWTFLYGV